MYGSTPTHTLRVYSYYYLLPPPTLIYPSLPWDGLILLSTDERDESICLFAQPLNPSIYPTDCLVSSKDHQTFRLIDPTHQPAFGNHGRHILLGLLRTNPEPLPHPPQGHIIVQLRNSPDVVLPYRPVTHRSPVVPFRQLVRF